MLTDDELRHRLRDLEAFNVERTESARNTDKLGEAPDVLEKNGRELVDQLRALALLHPDAIPTVAGILVLGRDPRNWLPGAYIQFVRYAGTEVTDTLRDQKEIDGSLSEILRRLDEVLEANVAQRSDLSGTLMIVKPD